MCESDEQTFTCHYCKKLYQSTYCQRGNPPICGDCLKASGPRFPSFPKLPEQK